MTRCDLCGLPCEDLAAGICADCHLPNYHQDQDQDQDVLSAAASRPSPGGNDEPGILEIALDEYERGNLKPVQVELGPMPPSAGKVMRAIADDMRLLMGLRLALGEGRPLPYSVRFAVKRGVASDTGTAGNGLRALERFGVVEHVDSMPPLRPGLDGTKLYAPPAATDGSLRRVKGGRSVDPSTESGRHRDDGPPHGPPGGT